MAVAAGTGTTSGSPSSSVSYGNLFSEAVTAIGTGLSKLVPEEEELQAAGETFLVGLMPDLLSGSLIDITAGVVGGGLALGVGLLFTPEALVAAGFAAAITLAAGKYITEQELNQKASKKSNTGKGGQLGGSTYSVTKASPGGVLGLGAFKGHGAVVMYSNGGYLESFSGSAGTESASWIGGKNAQTTFLQIHYSGRTTGSSQYVRNPNGGATKVAESLDFGRTTVAGYGFHNRTHDVSNMRYSDNYGRTKDSIFKSTYEKTGFPNTVGATDSFNYGKTVRQDYATWLAGEPVSKIELTSVSRTVRNYGRTTTYQRSSERTGKSTYQQSVDYGKTRIYRNKQAGGTSVYEASHHYGATRTYENNRTYERSVANGRSTTYRKGATYERNMNYGETRTYHAARTYQKSASYGRTKTYNNGVTSDHSINYGQTFTYQSGANYTHSIQGGRTFTRENASTSLKSRNSGASFTETLGRGQTRIHSIHSGATFTESKNGGATFLHESGGGRSYTSVHSGVEVMGRNYGQSYLYHNGAGVDFAYAPALGGTYFGGSVTQVGNGSVARHVLGLTANAHLPVL